MFKVKKDGSFVHTLHKDDTSSVVREIKVNLAHILSECQIHNQ